MAVFPVNPNIPIKINSILEITRASLPLSNLAQGETLTISVLEKLSTNQYLMSLKDGSITATSDIPLKAGDNLQVKVQSVGPQVVLNVIDTQKQSTDAKVNERLLQWRVNPDSLMQLLNKVGEFSENIRSGNLPINMSPKEIDGLMKLLGNIVFSSKTKANPLFVKDFVSQLGLLLETDLGKIVSHSAKDGGAPVLAENLKASLLKLSTAVTEALKDSPKLDSQITAKLTSLVTFTTEALKTIETRQAINVVYQQNESGLYLQIPMAMGEAMRQADIFITPDNKNAVGAKKYSSCSVAIFLDLDYLGEIAIDASLREGRIHGVIKCESEEVKQLVAASAEQLKEALGGIGYGVDQIDCLRVDKLQRKRAEYIEEQILGSTDLVNHFA